MFAPLSAGLQSPAGSLPTLSHYQELADVGNFTWGSYRFPTFYTSPLRLSPLMQVSYGYFLPWPEENESKE